MRTLRQGNEAHERETSFEDGDNVAFMTVRDALHCREHTDDVRFAPRRGLSFAREIPPTLAAVGTARRGRVDA